MSCKTETPTPYVVLKDEKRDMALGILVEEMAEVIQVVSKINRFGADDVHDGVTNRERLIKELGDTLCLIDYLIENGTITQQGLNQAKENKKEKLKAWSTLYD